MSLVAIIAPDVQGNKPKVLDLIKVHAKERKGRIANMRHIINLSTILPLFTEFVRPHPGDFALIRG
jgi:hypothetical protein